MAKSTWTRSPKVGENSIRGRHLCVALWVPRLPLHKETETAALERRRPRRGDARGGLEGQAGMIALHLQGTDQS